MSQGESRSPGHPGANVWVAGPVHLAGQAMVKGQRSSEDLVDDLSSQFLATVALPNILSPPKRRGNGVSGRELARSVAVGRVDRVFTQVTNANDLEHGGGSVGMTGRLALDFLFGLNPILDVTAGKSAVAHVDRFGAAADAS